MLKEIEHSLLKELPFHSDAKLNLLTTVHKFLKICALSFHKSFPSCLLWIECVLFRSDWTLPTTLLFSNTPGIFWSEGLGTCCIPAKSTLGSDPQEPECLTPVPLRARPHAAMLPPRHPYFLAFFKGHVCCHPQHHPHLLLSTSLHHNMEIFLWSLSAPTTAFWKSRVCSECLANKIPALLNGMPRLIFGEHKLSLWHLHWLMKCAQHYCI